LNLQGVLKLTDFGIATKLDEQGHCSNRTATMIYMAPEKFSKEWCAEPSDVWSLGLVVYELAMGTHPFAHIGNELELQAKLETPPKLSVDEVSNEMLCNFANFMLVQDPDDRGEVEKLLSHDFLKEGISLQKMSRWLRDLKEPCIEEFQHDSVRVVSLPSPMPRDRVKSILSRRGSCDTQRCRKSVTMRTEVEVFEVNRDLTVAEDAFLNFTSDEWVNVDQYEEVKNSIKHWSLAPNTGRLITNIDGKEHASRISQNSCSACCCLAGLLALCRER